VAEMASLNIISVIELKSRKERRAFPRIDVLANVKLHGAVGNYTGPCIIKDISLGGICLKADSRIFRIEEEIDVHFAFFPGKLLLPAKVVRVLERLDGVEHGIKYSNLNDQDKEKLKELLLTLIA
jgi:hypothetical protein